MSDLIKKINCPNGCLNPLVVESVRTVVQTSYQLLNESQQLPNEVKTVKVYHCNCCGNTFEMYDKTNSNLLL